MFLLQNQTLYGRMGPWLSLRPDQARWVPISQHLCLNWMLSSHQQGHEGGLLLCEGRAWERRQSTGGCVWIYCDRMPDRIPEEGKACLVSQLQRCQSVVVCCAYLGKKIMLAGACSRQEKEKELWGGARARYRFLTVYSWLSIGFQFVNLTSNRHDTRQSIKALDN